MKTFKIYLLLSVFVSLAYMVGRFYQYIKEQKNIIAFVPNKGFYFFGAYPWDGDHEEYFAELYGTISGIYDSEEYYDEVDRLNDMFYGEEE